MTTGPLRSLSVVAFTTGPLRYGGRLLADLGADVVAVEPPGTAGDDAGRSALLAGARSVTLALDAPAARPVVEALVGRSDVVLCDREPVEADRLRLAPDHLHAVNPRAVVASVTPFGRHGPRRSWRGTELTAWATSGMLPSIGDADRPPALPGGDLAGVTAAQLAVVGVLAALRSRARGAAGPFTVDVSMQEALLETSMEVGLLAALDGGWTIPRTGARRPFPPIGHYPTRDGAVAIVGFMAAHWDALADWIADEVGIEEVRNEAFRGTPMNRGPFAEVVDTWIEALTTRYGKLEFTAEAQRRGIPTSPVATMADIAADPHLAAVGAWVGDGEGGRTLRSPFRMSATPPAVGCTPAPGEHNDAVYRDDLEVAAEDLHRLRQAGTV